jgi:hypothetical protein
MGLRQAEREGDHSPPSSANVKIGEDILPLPHKSSWGCVLLRSGTILPLTLCLTRIVVVAFRKNVRQRPPLWSSGQSFWLQIQSSQVRFPVLPHFLKNNGSGTGSTQPREDTIQRTPASTNTNKHKIDLRR